MATVPPPKEAPKSSDDQGFNALALLVGVRKHWAFVAALTVVAAGIAFLYSKSQPKVYQATALMQFDPNPVRPMGDKSDPMMGWAFYFDSHEMYETQFKIVASDSLLSEVVRDVGLARDPAFIGKIPPGSKEATEAAIAALRGRLQVEPVKNTRLFYLRIDDTDPQLAARLCDAVARNYVEHNLRKGIDESSDAALWLSGEVDHYRSELEQNENQLHEFKKKNDLPSSTLEEVSKMIRLEMQNYDEALTHTRTRKQELSARHTELSKITIDNVESLPASELLNNGYLQQLRAQYLAAGKERNELLAAGKGESHPLVRTADEKILTAKKALIDEVKNIQGAVQRDLAVVQHQEQGELALYEEARKRAVELNLKELEYHRIDRQRAQNEKMYGTLLERMKEADLARRMKINNVGLVDPPTVPKAPIRPNTPLNIGVGALVGLLLGLALAVLREQLDTSLKTSTDVEEKLGVTFLGMMPAVDDKDEKSAGAKRRRGDQARASTDDPALYVHQRPLSTVAESARSVRTNLTFMSPDHPFQVVLVTSSAPAEGKTTVAASLAIAMAQAGQRVCIIDCDLRRPRLHRVFGRPGDVGLTSVLVGDATLDDVALPARAGPGGGTIANLYCIPAGSPPPNPADLLHSERFKNTLAELRRRFDRIVIDSSPLTAVTDAAIVSTLTDATIFVIRAFATSHHVARQGLRALRDVDCRIAGAILNGIDLAKHGYGYYYPQYYYYRREGYGPRDDDETAAPAPPN